jgi:predicted phosphodiesterase
MSKILFIADIHIKLGQKDVPVAWATNRFNLFIQQFAEMQKDADLVIVGGDIYDKVPSMDEVELYYDFVASITKPCIIYPGNHEAIKKTTTFLRCLKRSTNRLNPLVRVVDSYEYLPGFNLDIIPYNCLEDFKKNPDKYQQGGICASHFRAEIPPHVKPEIDLDLFNKWKVVLAGDLHSYENSQRNILYPGSPYTTSFHRSRVSTGAIMFDTDTYNHDWLQFQLPQLLKKTIQAGDTPVATEFDHTVFEIEGNLSDLSAVESNELISKKIVKRSNDSALLLDPKLSLAEEVGEYLRYILALPEDTIEGILAEYYQNISKLDE